MSKTYSGRQVLRALEKLGFKIRGQKGSHIKLRNKDCTVIVPNHKELKFGTLKGILSQATISLEEFKKVVK